LTLVTSADKSPTNGASAIVVTAKLEGKPFAPTLQGGRSDEQTGLTGDSGAWATFVLVMIAFVATVVGSVLLYRRLRFRTAYLLTIAPLVALMIVAGQTAARLLPAWT
jgi:sortase A